MILQSKCGDDLFEMLLKQFFFLLDKATFFSALLLYTFYIYLENYCMYISQNISIENFNIYPGHILDTGWIGRSLSTVWYMKKGILFA